MTHRTITLRPYQLEAIAAVERELATRRSTLLVLPTGAGKTVVFARLVADRFAAGQRCLVLAHRTELLQQAQDKLSALGVPSSLDQAGKIAPRASHCVVASVQTLRGNRLARYAADHFGLVVVDEAHRSAAASYQAVLSHLAGAQVLGVTATPDRLDGKGLGAVYSTVAYSYELRAAIRDGWLAPIRARRIEVEGLDLSSVKSRAGDLASDQLSAVLRVETALHGTVGPLLEQAGTRPTLVFAVDVEHSRALADVINRHRPGAALSVDGEATPAWRAAALAMFRRGTIQFLVNCQLYTEGLDEPYISCIAMVRPTASRALYCQSIGRGSRRCDGKTDVLVLDFTGNSGRHRLIGPADALAGRDLDEKTRVIVERHLDGQLELDEVLAAAEAEARRVRLATNLTALAYYREHEIDLFVGEHLTPWDPDSAAAKRPPTEAQLAELERCKLGKPPLGMSEAEAAALLEAVGARRTAGLCTIPQARILERMGVDTKRLPFARASQLIGAVAARNAWGRAHLVLSGEPEYRGGRRRA